MAHSELEAEVDPRRLEPGGGPVGLSGCWGGRLSDRRSGSGQRCRATSLWVRPVRRPGRFGFPSANSGRSTYRRVLSSPNPDDDATQSLSHMHRDKEDLGSGGGDPFTIHHVSLAAHWAEG